jgi:HPt (histidine-containing phosphotransfer) domain-containing protein
VTVNEPEFDASALDDLVAIGDGTLVRRLLEQFETDHHATVRRIGEAVSAGEWDRVRRDAHTLKSSSRFVGLHEVGHLAEEIEQRARTGKADPRAQAALVDAMARGVAAFRAFVVGPQ